MAFVISLSQADSNNNEVSNRLLAIMLEAMVPPATASQERGEATPIPLRALNLIAMHPKIRLMEMVKVSWHNLSFSLPLR